MNGLGNLLIDTNVIIYALEGREEVKPYMFSSLWVSHITKIELLGVKNISDVELARCEYFLNDCTLVDYYSDLTKITVEIKQKYSIKVPDAIIAATSIYLQIPLLTSDKGFTKIPELELILLELN